MPPWMSRCIFIAAFTMIISILFDFLRFPPTGHVCVRMTFIYWFNRNPFCFKFCLNGVVQVSQMTNSMTFDYSAFSLFFFVFRCTPSEFPITTWLTSCSKHPSTDCLVVCAEHLSIVLRF